MLIQLSSWTRKDTWR